MSLFNQIIAYLNGEDLQAMLSQDLQSYMYDAYSLVMRLQQHVVGPIALSILAIFVLLEFQKISMKVEGAGGAPMLGFEMIMKALIKFVLCYIVILRIQDILDGIIIITSNLTARVIEVGNDGVLNNVADRVSSAVADLSWWEQLVILLVMCIMFLVSLVVRVLIQVTIYLRFLELYIFLCYGTNPNGGTSKPGIFSNVEKLFQEFCGHGTTSNIYWLGLSYLSAFVYKNHGRSR